MTMRARHCALLAALAGCGPHVNAGDSDEDSSGAQVSGTIGDEDTSAGSTLTTDTADGSDDSPPGCPGTCVELPGDPWRGPLAMRTHDTLLGVPCPTAYPMSIATFGTVLVNTDAPCECQCTTPNASACSAELGGYLDEACGELLASGPVQGECTEVVLDTATAVQLGPIELGEGCEAFAVVPNSEFAAQVQLCEPTTASTCSDGSACAEVPDAEFEPRVCVWQAGEQACPPGFDDARIVYSATDDQRTCAPGCACEGSPICTGDAVMHVDCDRDGLAGTALEEGECAPASGTIAMTPRFEVEGQCAPTGATTPVMGDIFEDAPQTICCRDLP